MAKYLVRVELHGADGADYDELHKEMKKRGFSRQVKGSNGKVYHLPTAEYCIRSDRTTVQILNLADEARIATGCSGEILVAAYTELRWRGLTEV